MCEHVLPGKIADNIARRAGRFRCPIIRVWKTPIPLIYNSRVVRKEGSFSGQRMGVCLLPGKSLSGARTGLTDSAVSAFGCSAAVLFYQSGTARRSAPPPFSPSSQQWGMGREPHGCPPLLTFPQSTGARISPFPAMGYGAGAPWLPTALDLSAEHGSAHLPLPSNGVWGGSRTRMEEQKNLPVLYAAL